MYFYLINEINNSYLKFKFVFIGSRILQQLVKGNKSGECKFQDFQNTSVF